MFDKQPIFYEAATLPQNLNNSANELPIDIAKRGSIKHSASPPPYLGANYYVNECRGVIVLEKTETRNIRPRVLFTLYFIINSAGCAGVREEESRSKLPGTGKILVEGTKNAN